MLEQRLLETFTRAMNWNAMVLLDDVDIYGYDRAQSEYKRAALLSTFLRQLEYSECFTFISMATIKDADRALESRVHVVIPFPRFDYSSQIQIWQRFIKSLDSNQVNVSLLIGFILQEISGLDGGKHMHMNAWQIRSCIDVALTLARKDATAQHILQPEHIRTVLRLGESFRVQILQEQRELVQDQARYLGIADHVGGAAQAHI